MAIEIISWDEAKFEDFLLFHHLPKTAGSVISDALVNLYGPDNYKWFQGPHGALEEINKGTTYKAVGGHFSLNHPTAREINKRMIVFTLFRDPIDRVISNYYLYRNAPGHPLHTIASNYSLGEIYRQGMGRKMQIQNEITRRVATDSDKALDSAKQTVDNYTFFGLQEQSRVLELIIKRLFNLSQFTIPEIVARDIRPRGSEVELEVLDLIKEYNSYDIELYEYAKEVYERKLRTDWLYKRHY